MMRQGRDRRRQGAVKGVIPAFAGMTIKLDLISGERAYTLSVNGRSAILRASLIAVVTSR
jgi:hypothetical protein